MDFTGIVSWVHRSGRELRGKARHNCFVSHETGLEGRLLVSVSQAETKLLDFQGLSGFISIPPFELVLGACVDNWPKLKAN
jgi:hypothetical protein